MEILVSHKLQCCRRLKVFSVTKIEREYTARQKQKECLTQATGNLFVLFNRIMTSMNEKALMQVQKFDIKLFQVVNTKLAAALVISKLKKAHMWRQHKLQNTSLVMTFYHVSIHNRKWIFN
jgi:hypothetical protein